MNFILAVKIAFKIQSGIFYEGGGGGMKKVNTNIFLFVDPVAMETELNKRLRKDISSNGCLHYNKVYSTKYGINSFKSQGIKILNDLKKINFYQNNMSKSTLRSLILLSCRVFFIYFVLIKILSTFSSSYPVATSVFIV